MLVYTGWSSRRHRQDQNQEEEAPDVEQGINRQLPGRVVKLSATDKEIIEDCDSGSSECAICFDDFEDGDWCKVLPKCDHMYHETCIDKWLVKNMHCPLCRGFVASSPCGDAQGDVLNAENQV
ncbi:hypothetical protein Tsubulata_017580 [Turnera subulata]|uniref:RING-type domain-containing protein n=1 Tax=Turnera subulata TaxID=218843 RepID=A0A9Q0G8R7_9ROSI|nr:hypothetical protein Tsubulata_017580 [Turnera subulata]